MTLKIKIPKSTYSVKSIRDTIYWFSNDYTIILDESTDKYVIEILDNTNDDFKKLFISSLNDYSLRDTIKLETTDIRNLVASKAFYPDLVNFDPVGEFDDPINIEERNEKTKHS